MMNFLRRIGAALARCWACLDRPRVLFAAALLLPILSGLVSLSYGQDSNWDLLNYHYYTPYALLNGKIGVDLAPGQWQTYFNPTLDLLYYGLHQACPPRVVGFLMGWLHGLNAVLVVAIARRVLPATSHRLAAVLLALGGCLQPGFLSAIGNSMGDNLSALFVLGALLLLLRSWPRLLQGQGARMALLAGLVMGLGTGLKLTNATYALAMCLALLVAPLPFWRRIWQPFVFGLGVLGGIAVSAGHWYWRMWEVFGNPLFPQFNNFFRAPLAAPLGIGDTGWLPQGWAEKVLWPFFFYLMPNSVSELSFHLLIWPVLYVLAFALLWVKARQVILARAVTPPLRAEVRFLFAFAVLAYLLWLNLFSIYRYLAPLELMAPLLLWLVLEGMFRRFASYRWPVLAVAALALAGLPPANWGHAGWTEQAFRAEVPVIASPKDSLVFTVHGDPPMSWLVPFFPKELAFVSLGSGFPESDAYGERVKAMFAGRKGPVYVMIDTSIPNGPRYFWPRLVLGRYGLRMAQDACVEYAASIGINQHNYLLCPVYQWRR